MFCNSQLEFIIITFLPHRKRETLWTCDPTQHYMGFSTCEFLIKFWENVRSEKQISKWGHSNCCGNRLSIHTHTHTFLCSYKEIWAPTRVFTLVQINFPFILSRAPVSHVCCQSVLKNDVTMRNQRVTQCQKSTKITAIIIHFNSQCLRLNTHKLEKRHLCAVSGTKNPH